MNATLTFEYEFSRDDDDFGWLTARVETPDFSGRNGMWVQWQDIVAFGASLHRYPIEATHPLSCEWGFGEAGRYEVVTKVVIAPQGATGGLIVDVDVANYYDHRNRCRTQFLTDCPSLARFREQIETMMRREAQTAALCGTKAGDR